MEGWVGLVGWPIADTLPTKWSHVIHRSGKDRGKFASQLWTLMAFITAANDVVCSTTTPVGTQLHPSTDFLPVWFGWQEMASDMDGMCNVVGKLKWTGQRLLTIDMQTLGPCDDTQMWLNLLIVVLLTFMMHSLKRMNKSPFICRVAQKKPATITNHHWIALKPAIKARYLINFDYKISTII